MLKISPGRNWKLNPEYLESLRSVRGPQARHFSPSAVLDVLGIEVDGVDIAAGLAEGAIFHAMQDLVAAASRLCQEPSSAAAISLGGAAVELLLVRRGTKASLSLVSLGRPARILVPDVEVELEALLLAVREGAQALLSDLAEVNPALSRSSFALGIRRALARLSPKPGSKRRRAARPQAAHIPRAPLPRRDPGEGAPTVGFDLRDQEGRLDSYRGGGTPDLYSLLAPGHLFLHRPDGEELAAVAGPPFLMLWDLARAAGELLSALDGTEARRSVPLSDKGPQLSLDLHASLLTVDGRSVPCPPLALARAFLEAAIDFAGAVSARNPRQLDNPYLLALSDEARERLAELRQREAGDLLARGPALKSSSEPRREPQLPLSSGRLRRLRFHEVFRRTDLGAAADPPLRLTGNTLLVAAGGGLHALNARTGETAWSRGGASAALSGSHLLIAEASGRLLLVDPATGAARWTRRAPSAEDSSLWPQALPLTDQAGHTAGLVSLLATPAVTGMLLETGLPVWELAPPGATRAYMSGGPGLVFVATDNGFLYALEAASGRQVWRVRTGGAFQGPPVLAGKTLFALTQSELTLVAVEAASGRPKLALPLELSRAGAPLSHRSRLLIPGELEGESALVAVGPSGRELWRKRLELGPGVPALLREGDALFASGRTGAITRLGADGSIAWVRSGGPAQELFRSLPPLLRRNLLVAPGEVVRLLEPDSGEELGHLPPLPDLGGLAADDELNLFLCDEDGLLVGYRLGTHLSVV